jgi:hypothetical protein
MHLRKTCGDGKGDVEGTREGLVHDICDMHLVFELRNATACVGAVDELGFLAGAGRHLDSGVASPMRLAHCPIDSRERSICLRV